MTAYELPEHLQRFFRSVYTCYDVWNGTGLQVHGPTLDGAEKLLAYAVVRADDTTAMLGVYKTCTLTSGICYPASSPAFIVRGERRYETIGARTHIHDRVRMWLARNVDPQDPHVLLIADVIHELHRITQSASFELIDYTRELRP